MTAATEVVDLDVRGLEPPEPMERVLDTLGSLPAGAQLRMLIEREPRPLYRILSNNGYAWRTTALPDFLWEVRIWQAPPPEADEPG